MDIPSGALSYNGHSYYIFDTGINDWSAAQQYCKSRGGDLAVINDEDENDALFWYMVEQGYDYAFFGYSDLGTEGTWSWVSGQKSDFEDWGQNANGDWQPNGDSPAEDYAQLNTEMEYGTWNDSIFGYNTNAFICEWTQ